MADTETVAAMPLFEGETPPPVAEGAVPASVQTYGDIVWRQFKANRLAYWSLWALVPMTALGIFAPLLCSNQPFVFSEPGRTLYPWWHSLFHTSEPIDYLFNMSLLALFPTGVVGAFCLWWWRKQRLSAYRRARRLVGLYGILTGLVCIVCAIPEVRPNNEFADRTFAAEELAAPQTRRGQYAPIPFGPIEQDLQSVFKPPMYRAPRSAWTEANDGYPHVLGTDNTGRDVLVRMIYGTRISITIGFVAVGIYLLIGCLFGAIAGYYGGTTDMLISRLIEVIMLFPAFFLILTLVGLIGPSIYMIMLVIGLTSWPGIARLIRGEVLKQRQSDYVTAALALGFSHTRIILRHILPNALTPALVAAPFGVAGAIITEAGLSLLGFGVRAPAPSWGLLLKLGSENYAYWWLAVIPSLAIFFTVTIFNLIGNGLRDAMDPRLRK